MEDALRQEEYLQKLLGQENEQKDTEGERDPVRASENAIEMDDDFEGEREDQKAPDDEEGDAPDAEDEEEVLEEQFNPDQAMGDNSDATDANTVREL